MTKNKQLNQPLVSVVIPVYNGAPFLKEAVYSVVKNTYKHIELILVNDGSTDKSREICKKLKEKYKQILLYSFKKNRGLSRVLNFALAKARGKYICRLNQDDEMHSLRIKKQVQYLNSNPDVVLVGSWLVVEDENKNRRINKFLEKDEDIKKTWLKLSPCWDASVMYLRKAALKVGGYDQNYWPADDLHMWYRLGHLGKIANIQEPLVKIKFHAAAASVRYHRQHMLTTYRVHQWANKNIQKANFSTQLFWLGELIAGLLLPARFNWYIYRLIKKYFVYSIIKPDHRRIQRRLFFTQS